MFVRHLECLPNCSLCKQNASYHAWVEAVQFTGAPSRTIAPETNVKGKR